MNNLFLDDNKIMDFELLSDRSIKNYFYSNIVIYYVLEGTLTLSSCDETFELKSGDYILMNAFQRHSYKTADHTLAVGFIISVSELSKYYDLNNIEFRCNSLLETEVSNERMKRLLSACVNHYYGKRAQNGRTLVHLNSIYYQIIEVLVSDFSVYITNEEQSLTGGSDENRMNDIINYIHLNYKMPISLSDLAEKFYMSTAYLSRYIKKKLGQNFGDYLAGVRLEFAVNELEQEEKSMTKIALDNGFPNIASFNKKFKEQYGMTPKSYRDKIRNQAKEQEQSQVRQTASDSINNDVEYRLMDYFEHSEDIESGKNEEIVTQIEVDNRLYQKLQKKWCKLINVGRIVTLLRGDIQEHLIYLKQNLNIEYVRLWDLYDEEMKLNINSPDGRHNFSKLDKIIDFLVTHHMRPYFELGFKPIILMLTNRESLINEPRKILFKNNSEYQHFLNSMMIHFVNRYGMQEVSKWYFEQWCDPRLLAEHGKAYFETFDTAYRSIKNVVPEAHVGGAYDRDYELLTFEALVKQWHTRKILPDFISMYCYLMTEKWSDYDSHVRYVADDSASLTYQRLKMRKEIMEAYDMHMPIIVSEWNMTVVNRNVINDSCAKATFIMDMLMHIYEYVDMVGYWFGTDLFVETEESPNLLDGCCGLLSYHGICKPAFYAMEFMNRQEEYLLRQDKDLMISANGYDNYNIVCANHKELDIQYYMQDENELEIERIPMLFKDTARKRINIKINHVHNGLYYVKTRSLSPKWGSVQDEWYRMGLVKNLSEQDIEYLRRISTPKISFYECNVANGTLELSVSMDAHEIQAIHIFRQLQE